MGESVMGAKTHPTQYTAANNNQDHLNVLVLKAQQQKMPV